MQINPNRSTSVFDTHYGNASSSEIPTVCFDLGNEWDEWGDFDDENLLHASETSLTLCSSDAQSQIQHAEDSDIAGRVSCVLLRRYHLLNQSLD